MTGGAHFCIMTSETDGLALVFNDGAVLGHPIVAVRDFHLMTTKAVILAVT